MPRTTPLPAPLGDRPFSVAEARTLGVSRGRLAGADLVRIFHGVRVPRGSPALLTEAEAFALDDPWAALNLAGIARADAAAHLVGGEVVFSHVTAARLHRMPLPARLARDLDVHVSTAQRSSRPEIGGVVAHLSPRDVRRPVFVEGLAVTDPVQTWCALAPLLTLVETTVIGDHLVRRREPDSTLEDLREAVRRSAGRHGAPRLRSAMELVRPRTDSPRETVLRLLIVDGGLPEPVVNAPILDLRGSLIRHGDLAYEQFKVLVEYNGEQHRTDSDQYRLDLEQLDRIIAAGWTVVHVVKGQLQHPTSVVSRIRAALTARGWR